MSRGLVVSVCLAMAATVATAGTRGEAEEAYRVGDYDRAVRLAEELSRAAPDAPTLLLLGKATMRAGKLEAALVAFDRALAKDGSLPGAHFFKGSILGKLGRRTEAKAELERELKVTPRSTAARYALALVLRELGEKEQAAATLVDLLAIAADDVPARVLLVTTYLELDRPNDATLEIVKLPSGDKGTAPLAHNVGLAFFKKGQDSQCVRALQIALKADRDHAPSWYLFGLARVRQQRGDDARENLERYLELAPDGPDAAEARRIVAQLRGGAR